MLMRNTLPALGLLAGSIALASAAIPAAANAAECPIDRPVLFGGLDYNSAAFHNAVARTILEEGYGCETDTVPGTVLILNQGLMRGDVDLIMEIWTANPAQGFLDAEAAGKAERLGATFPDATEGWYVPRYVVEGADAPAPELKTAQDLADYTELFADPEEPGMGRFYNCVAGWVCEGINTKKLIAYGLDDKYSNVRPGSGAAIQAAVESAYLREKPVVFYHWSPTALLGRYDFVRLDEPAYEATVWKEMLASDKPTAATAYPNSKVVIGANTDFGKEAPALREMLARYSTTAAQTSAALAYMQENNVEPEEAARHFLQTQEAVWTPWVPAEVAGRVRSAVAD